MPSFPKPDFPYNFSANTEIAHLQSGKIATKRNEPIPQKLKTRLLVATWNIANLGEQKREPAHHQLIAEILSWFDLVAIQEVKDNLGDMRSILSFLPVGYKLVFSDTGGNNERSMFLYDSNKLEILEEVGEVNVPPSEYRFIKLPGVVSPFNGFDRNPYVASFKKGDFRFSIVSVHSFFGGETAPSLERRSLETFAIARWAALRRDGAFSYVNNYIALGDFNLPKAEPGDPIFEALTQKGLELPKHSTKVYSNITDDKQYDQIAFFPGLKSSILKTGVFSFDNFVFPDLYETKTKKQFQAYIRYYMSDHRPMWIQLEI